MSLKDAAKKLSTAMRDQVEAVLAKHMLWSPRLEHRGSWRTDVVLNDGRRFVVQIVQPEDGGTVFHITTTAVPAKAALAQAVRDFWTAERWPERLMPTPDPED